MKLLHPLFAALTLSLTLASVGCGDDGASCEKVLEHTLSLMPKEMGEGLSKDRDAALKRCEKETTPKQRACILKAKDLGAMAACK